jgi:hypothetical protein
MNVHNDNNFNFIINMNTFIIQLGLNKTKMNESLFLTFYVILLFHVCWKPCCLWGFVNFELVL